MDRIHQNPQSNEQAERFVNMQKRGLQTPKGEGTMEEVPSTLRTALGEKSLAGVLMGRKVRTVHEEMPSEKALPNKSRRSRKSGLAVNTSVYAFAYRLGRQ
ncbi:hypothetical protein ACTXT7_005725 [Hymenolepis weldensis]